MQGELKRANGTSMGGSLGAKRKDQIKELGFSPKNFVQLFRLAYVGVQFFNCGDFPVNLKDYDLDFRNYLYEIKTNPENWKVEDLNEDAVTWERDLVKAFESRSVDLSYNEHLANEYLLEFYHYEIENYLSGKNSTLN